MAVETGITEIDSLKAKLKELEKENDYLKSILREAGIDYASACQMLHKQQAAAGRRTGHTLGRESNRTHKYYNTATVKSILPFTVAASLLIPESVSALRCVPGWCRSSPPE